MDSMNPHLIFPVISLNWLCCLTGARETGEDRRIRSKKKSRKWFYQLFCLHYNNPPIRFILRTQTKTIGKTLECLCGCA